MTHETFFKTGIIYHGNQSSTSSDLSPMSEQKSLPRRGRPRYHQQTYTTNTTPRHTRQPPQSTSNTPTITPTTLLAASPRSSSSNSNKTRMPSNTTQFRPIQHRTMNYPITRQSPSC